MIDSTLAFLQAHNASELDVDDLTPADLPHIAWSGSTLHVESVGRALKRVERGEVEYLAVRSPEGWPVAIGGIDYAAHEGAGTLWQLVTHEGLRGHGIGTRLIAEAEQRIQQRGLEWASLSVEVENLQAQALYHRLGYEVSGQEEETWDAADASGKIYTYHAHVDLMRKRLT